MTEIYRIAIAGADTLRGKQLKDELSESAFGGSNFLLLDDAQSVGKIDSVGEEATVIQPVASDSFEHTDFVFFAGTPQTAQKYWQNAVRAGATVVDLSFGLEGETGVLVRAPWLYEENRESIGNDNPAPVLAPVPGPHTPAIVSAHPAAVVLALLAERAQKVQALRGIYATVLEPASEYGREAMDELHQQTVALLSFQNLPKQIYDAQVAFNAIPAGGEASKINLGETEARILRHYALLSAGKLPALSLQLIHAPVFHGQDFSVALEFDKPVTFDQLHEALSGSHVELTVTDDEAPSNLGSAGQEEVLVRIHSNDPQAAHSTRFWLWAATDNLKVSAANAIECAQELRKLRPRGKVQ